LAEWFPMLNSMFTGTVLLRASSTPLARRGRAWHPGSPV
jgi:hypothetical protein